jgi:hypothetical protein
MIAQKVIPPMVGGLGGGTIGLDHPKKAVAVMSKLPPAHLADAAPYLDPRAAENLVPMLPAEAIILGAKELFRRRDYITAARFVDFITAEHSPALERELDDEGLVRTAIYTQSADRLSNVIRLFAPTRIRRMIITAVTGPTDLRLGALSMIARIDDDLQTMIGDIVFDETDSTVVTDLLRTVVREGAVAELLTIASHPSPASLDMVAANPAMKDQQTLEAAVQTAAGQELWSGLMDIVERVDEDTQRRVMGIVRGLDEGRLAALAHIATERHLWPVLLRILASQDADTQRRIAKTWRDVSSVDKTSLDRHIQALGLSEISKPIREELALA